ncbi:Hsp20 family protein [Rhizobium sp. MHM7A]|uniref:Hsp20 family protein n=1 Tax=Rhizobium sp. MHM7A TaxID=2583233 RepID=UPI0014874EFE|nr:Hsp20 family protein [Rhizobium sp. MHM7A]
MSHAKSINPAILQAVTRIFDNVLPLTETPSSLSSFPPYDIVKTGENETSIIFALAGYAPENIEVTVEDRVLSVVGNPKKDEEVEYLHRGIANRAFGKRFKLGEYVEVKDASHRLGLLEIKLERIVPVERQLRKVEINAALASEPTA